MDGSSSDEDDDPVVCEVDVCLAKDLLDKLYLFQYPVRPSNMTYDHTSHLHARMKPKQQKVELELGMDVTANTYSQSRGQQIAESVDGDSSQDSTFDGGLMDRHLLSSVRATEDSSKYVAGIYSDGVLHLTPVNGVVQLRPTFNYFDRADEVQKKNAAAMKEDGDSSQSEEEVDEAKPVQLRFAKTPRGGGPSANKANRMNQQAEAEELWLEMRFHQPHDALSLSERNRLYCRHDNYEAPELTATTRDYMKSLQPQMVADASAPAAMPHGVLSLTSLKKMDLKDQIKALLLNAKVVQLRQLCTLLGSRLDERVIIDGLRQYARLVQGCWVVRSELLYAPGTRISGTGIPAEKLWPSRDYILFSFNRKRLLSRKEVISATKLPPEDLREMLEQIARQRPSRGWEFMLSTDIDFLHKYQEIANEEFELWTSRYKELVEQLQLSEDNWKDGELSGLSSQAHQKPKSPQRRIRNTNSINEEPKSPKKVGRCQNRTSSQSNQESDTELNVQIPTVTILMQAVKLEKDSPTMSKKSPVLNQNNLVNGPFPMSTSVTQTSTKHCDTQEILHNQENMRKQETLKSIIKCESPGNEVGISGIVSEHIEMRTQEITKKKEIRFDDSDDSDGLGIVRNSLLKLNNEKQPKRQKTKQSIPAGEKPSNSITNLTKRTPKDKKTRKNISKNIVSSSSDSDASQVKAANNYTSLLMNSEPTECDPNSLAMEVEVGGASLSNDSMDDDSMDDINEQQIFVPPPVANRKLSDEERPPSEIFLKELERFVRESLRAGCLSLREFKEVLELRQKEPRNILCTGVPDELLIETILVTGAIEVPLKWSNTEKIPLDRRRVFVYRRLGEPNDQYREIVIRLFHGSFGLRRKDIVEAFKSQLGAELTNYQYTKMMTEFCENHHGHWYLNGTYKSYLMANS